LSGLAPPLHRWQDDPMAGAYTHGHHESVLRSHLWRTAENSAAYLLGSLEPGQDLLDAGCGPGTITLDLAARVAPGRVVGIDAAEEVVARAEALRAERSVANVEFSTGDLYRLRFGEARFDVAHAHQVLQHLTDPVVALFELRRVLRPGGLLAVREADFGAFAWWPADPELDRWLELYHQVTARNGAEADAGRRLASWVRAAGFGDLTVTSSTWTFADPEARAFWGGLWADRVRLSSFAGQAVAYGLSDEHELGAIAAAWRRWAEAADGFFAVLNAEVLARR
jgi:ubiquinone/menaquinone biosynthesis C-methylase UbiE